MLGLSWEEQCNITFFDTEGMFLLERLTLRDGDRIVVGQVCCPSAICKGGTLFGGRIVLFLHGCTPYLFKMHPSSAHCIPVPYPLLSISRFLTACIIYSFAVKIQSK